MEPLTRVLARFARELDYDAIAEPARAAARRLLFDSLGCALGGRRQHDVDIVRGVLRDLGGHAQATLIGSRERVSVVQATLVNSLMIRAMDYNDIYWMQDPSHPSDLIPAALSVGEWVGADGREVLTGIVLAYEIEMRLCEFAVPGIRERGWHHATLTQVAAPLVAGRMLGLDEDRLVAAAGICASCHATTGSVTAGDLTMMKNTVDPMATAAGVEAALLARGGYTGPVHVLDGKEGLMHCLGEGWDRDALVGDLGREFRIVRCGMKAFPTEALTHAPITATLRLVRRHGIAPDAIAAIRVRTIARAADILSDPSKYDPKTRETADHSLPWCLAAACARGRVTPAEFSPEALADPAIRGLLERIHVEADPEFEALFPQKQPNRVTIETTLGETFEEYVEYPLGHWRAPLERDDLVAKFEALAAPDLDPGRVAAVYDLVMEFEALDSMAPLFEALRAEG